MNISFFCYLFRRFIEEEFIIKIMYQLVEVFKECYRRKNGVYVLYRDFKLVNVFLDGNNDVKLGDFGLVRVF